MGVVCALVCWGLGTTETARWLENWTCDVATLFRGGRPTSTHVVIVGITDNCLRSIDKPLAFLSPELARVVTYVHEHGAAAVGIDVLLPATETTPDYYLPGAPGDAGTVGVAVLNAGNVVLPMWNVRSDRWILPAYEWQPFRPDWNDLAFVNLTPDRDMFTRRQLLRAADDQGQLRASLALAVFAEAMRFPREWFEQPQLQLDGKRIPLDSDGMLPINYLGPPGTVKTIPFRTVLAAESGKEELRHDFEDAIVLIGITADAQPDRHSTPYANQSVASALRKMLVKQDIDRMAGVEIHANVIATLGDRAFISTPWWLSTPLTLVVVGAVLGAAITRTSLAWGAVIALVHHWTWKAFAVAVFWWGSYRVDVVPMLLLGVMVYGVVFALRWRLMRQMMGLFKSELVAQALEADPSKAELRGEEREVTILFTDVRDFTSLSEKRTPQEVVALLNTYFSVIVPEIELRGGTVNQYLGDGLMVIFGAPRHQPDHALRAVETAVAMIRAVQSAEHQWSELGAPAFRIGVGVHTGKAVIGTIGSPRRLDYTAIGDTVNTASRIETGTRHLDAAILISQATYDALQPQDRQRLVRNPAPSSLRMKGKENVIQVYPIGLYNKEVNNTGVVR